MNTTPSFLPSHVTVEKLEGGRSAIRSAGSWSTNGTRKSANSGTQPDMYTMSWVYWPDAKFAAILSWSWGHGGASYTTVALFVVCHWANASLVACE